MGQALGCDQHDETMNTSYQQQQQQQYMPNKLFNQSIQMNRQQSPSEKNKEYIKIQQDGNQFNSNISPIQQINLENLSQDRINQNFTPENQMFTPQPDQSQQHLNDPKQFDQYYQNTENQQTLQNNLYALEQTRNNGHQQNFDSIQFNTTLRGMVTNEAQTNNHQQLSSDYGKRIQMLEEIIDQCDKLVLRVVSSAILQKDLVLQITAQGLQGGFRQQLDGNVYFGFQKENMMENGEIQIVNDFIIPSIDDDTNSKHLGQHFQIFFDQTTKMYNIQDFGNGLGVFLRLTKAVQLKDNYLLSIGHMFLVVNLERNTNELSILLKLYDQDGHMEQRKFSNLHQKHITIGRSKQNDIYCGEDSLLSKTHCTLQYDKIVQEWFFCDNNSTNGSWIYLQEPLVVENGMVFKYNQTIFQAIICQ